MQPLTARGLRQAAASLLLAGAYALFVWAHASAFGREPRPSLLLLALFETLVVALILTRRPASRTLASPWAVAATAVGTFGPLLLRPLAGGADVALGQALQVAGTALQIAAVLSLGRSFGVLPAQRRIRTSGLYRLVRHPLYLAYFVTQAGYVLNHPTGWNVAVVALASAAQIARILHEERLLGADEAYAAYARLVRWRLVPGVW